MTRRIKQQCERCILSLLDLSLIIHHSTNIPHASLLTHPGHTYNASEQGDARHPFRWPGIDILCDRPCPITQIDISINDIRSIAQKRLSGQSGHNLEAQRASLTTPGELTHSKGNPTGGYCNNACAGENEETTTTQCIHGLYLPCGCPR